MQLEKRYTEIAKVKEELYYLHQLEKEPECLEEREFEGLGEKEVEIVVKEGDQENLIEKGEEEVLKE